MLLQKEFPFLDLALMNLPPKQGGKVKEPNIAKAYSKELKANVVKEFLESEITAEALCAKHDVNFYTFKWWCYLEP